MDNYSPIDSLLYWLALTHLPRMGGVTLHRLLNQYGSLEALFAAPPPAWAESINALSWPNLTSELADIHRHNMHLLTWAEATYPPALQALRSAPPVLFRWGDLHPTDAQAIAIVGSRRVSESDAARTQQLAEQLAAQGYTIISGLALGIDTAAHQGALTAPHGRTIAILGSGLLNIYPPENLSLAHQIATRGAILSEQRPLVEPQPAHLMMRNRLIAGLSQAVVVVAASADSGALETARQAHRLKRPVFACLGTPGTDLLLRQGAIPLSDSLAGQLATIKEHLQTPPSPAWVQGALW